MSFVVSRYKTFSFFLPQGDLENSDPLHLENSDPPKSDWVGDWMMPFVNASICVICISVSDTARRQCLQSAAVCCHTITPLEKCWNGPSDAHANLRFLVLLVLSYFQEIATDFPETSQVS